MIPCPECWKGIVSPSDLSPALMLWRCNICGTIFSDTLVQYWQIAEDQDNHSPDDRRNIFSDWKPSIEQ